MVVGTDVARGTDAVLAIAGRYGGDEHEGLTGAGNAGHTLQHHRVAPVLVHPEAAARRIGLQTVEGLNDLGRLRGQRRVTRCAGRGSDVISTE